MSYIDRDRDGYGAAGGSYAFNTSQRYQNATWDYRGLPNSSSNVSIFPITSYSISQTWQWSQ